MTLCLEQPCHAVVLQTLAYLPNLKLIPEAASNTSQPNAEQVGQLFFLNVGVSLGIHATRIDAPQSWAFMQLAMKRPQRGNAGDPPFHPTYHSTCPHLRFALLDLF